MTRKFQLPVLLTTALLTALIIVSTNKVAAVTPNTASFNGDISPVIGL